METISTLIKVSLPKYLQNLPIPSSIGGFGRLSGGDWVSLLPIVGAVSFIVYASVKFLFPPPPPPKPRVNPSIKKENPKVVDMVEIEDLDKEKIAYCRCWRSSKFPYCDGTHTKFNEQTGDNVGPLVLKKKHKN